MDWLMQCSRTTVGENSTTAVRTSTAALLAEASLIGRDISRALRIPCCVSVLNSKFKTIQSLMVYRKTAAKMRLIILNSHNLKHTAAHTLKRLQDRNYFI